MDRLKNRTFLLLEKYFLKAHLNIGWQGEKNEDRLRLSSDV